MISERPGDIAGIKTLPLAGLFVGGFRFTL